MCLSLTILVCCAEVATRFLSVFPLEPKPNAFVCLGVTDEVSPAVDEGVAPGGVRENVEEVRFQRVLGRREPHVLPSPVKLMVDQITRFALFPDLTAKSRKLLCEYCLVASQDGSGFG